MGDSSDVHIWQVTVGHSGAQTSGFYEIQAIKNPDDATEELEVSFASNEEGTTGIGCGVRMRSGGDNIYTKGVFADRDCSQYYQSSFCATSSNLSPVESGSGAPPLAAMCESSTPWATSDLTASIASTFYPSASSMLSTWGGIPALRDFNEGGSSDAAPTSSVMAPPPPAGSGASCNAAGQTRSQCTRCCSQQKGLCLEGLTSSQWRTALACNSAYSTCVATCPA